MVKGDLIKAGEFDKIKDLTLEAVALAKSTLIFFTVYHFCQNKCTTFCGQRAKKSATPLFYKGLRIFETIRIPLFLSALV